MITVGCWITTCWGPAVCVEITPTWVSYRYTARRCTDNALIHVLNGDPIQEVSFLRKASRYSKRICKLEGPYGEGSV